MSSWKILHRSTCLCSARPSEVNTFTRWELWMSAEMGFAPVGKGLGAEVGLERVGCPQAPKHRHKLVPLRGLWLMAVCPGCLARKDGPETLLEAAEKVKRGNQRVAGKYSLGN